MRIYGNYDVVIVGGGASGCCAAIAAAREGANTLVIEQLGAVGGMMNISGPPGWAFSHLYNESGERIVAGIVEELYQSGTIQGVVDILERTISIYEETMFSNKSSARNEVEKVKSYIYAHYAEELSVEILSNAVYLSPGYLSYIFKQETGEGLSHFIRQFRLEKAKELLCTTNMKIVQICKETGFTNASYFCKSFREYYGCSPERFRKTA